MKKLIAVMLFMTFVLAGCGTDGVPVSSTEQSSVLSTVSDPTKQYAKNISFEKTSYATSEFFVSDESETKKAGDVTYVKAKHGIKGVLAVDEKAGFLTNTEFSDVIAIGQDAAIFFKKDDASSIVYKEFKTSYSEHLPYVKLVYKDYCVAEVGKSGEDYLCKTDGEMLIDLSETHGNYGFINDKFYYMEEELADEDLLEYSPDSEEYKERLGSFKVFCFDLSLGKTEPEAVFSGASDLFTGYRFGGTTIIVMNQSETLIYDVITEETVTVSTEKITKEIGFSEGIERTYDYYGRTKTHMYFFVSDLPGHLYGYYTVEIATGKAARVSVKSDQSIFCDGNKAYVVSDENYRIIKVID